MKDAHPLLKSISTAFPFGIDTAGDIAGFYLDTKGVSHSFVRTAANGTFTSFDVPGADTAPLGLGPGTPRILEPSRATTPRLWSPRQAPRVHKVRSWSLSNSSDGNVGQILRVP
jgi:hypothetical protein